MNNNYDFASKKTMIILFFICMIFFMIILKAFDYLPTNEETTANPVRQQDVNKLIEVNKRQRAMLQNQALNQTSELEQSVEKTQVNEPIQKETKDLVLQQEFHGQEAPKDLTPSPEEALKPINEDISANNTINSNTPDNIISDKEKYNSLIAEAVNYTEQGNYENAINIYMELANKTQETIKKADFYDRITNVYIMQRRYGSALIYAQKAYRILPTSAREALLEKLQAKMPISSNQETKTN